MNKFITFLTVLLMSLIVGIAAEPLSFRTISGDIFEGCRITNLTDGRVTFSHSTGVASIPYEELTYDTQRKIGVAPSLGKNKDNRLQKDDSNKSRLYSNANVLSCTGCGREISGQYLKANDGSTYCSNRCFEKTLPICAVCKNRVKGGYLESDGKIFCSENCLEVELEKCTICLKSLKEWSEIIGYKFCESCIKNPKCSECLLPIEKYETYDDGRHVCRVCEKDTVKDEEKVEMYYSLARKELEKITGMKMGIAPKLTLLGRSELTKKMGQQYESHLKGILRGYYDRTERTLVNQYGVHIQAPDVEKNIYMLYGMRTDTYLVTGVHEHTHDLIAESFPILRDAPEWVHEGISQYTAYIFAYRNNLKNYCLMIENHPDSDYGGGFRYFKRRFGSDNWPKLHNWIRTVDASKLPEKAPK